MSKLQMTAHFDPSEHLPAPAGADSANDSAAFRSSARSNSDGYSARRRLRDTQLRLPSDDGFHLFRVY